MQHANSRGWEFLGKHSAAASQGRAYPFALQKVGHGIRNSEVDVSFASVEPLQSSIDVHQAAAAGLSALRGFRKEQEEVSTGFEGRKDMSKSVYPRLCQSTMSLAAQHLSN
jgi:hypothetical protein